MTNMEQRFRTVIIDDEPNALKVLEELFTRFPEIEVVGKTHYPMEAVDIIKELEPDALFLDIEMPGKTGFDILDELTELGLSPKVVFVTGFSEYAIRAIRYAAFDYLLKPVALEELKHVIGRLHLKNTGPARDEQVRLLKEGISSSKVLKFSSTGGFFVVKPEDILYIKADWNFAEIHFEGDKQQTSTMSIGAIEALLPAGHFFRISRSVIINVTLLTRVNRKKRLAVLTKNGREYCFMIPLANIRKLEKFLE